MNSLTPETAFNALSEKIGKVPSGSEKMAIPAIGSRCPNLLTTITLKIPDLTNFENLQAISPQLISMMASCDREDLAFSYFLIDAFLSIYYDRQTMDELLKTQNIAIQREPPTKKLVPDSKGKYDLAKLPRQQFLSNCVSIINKSPAPPIQVGSDTMTTRAMISIGIGKDKEVTPAYAAPEFNDQYYIAVGCMLLLLGKKVLTVDNMTWLDNRCSTYNHKVAKETLDLKPKWFPAPLCSQIEGMMTDYPSVSYYLYDSFLSEVAQHSNARQLKYLRTTADLLAWTSMTHVRLICDFMKGPYRHIMRASPLADEFRAFTNWMMSTVQNIGDMPYMALRNKTDADSLISISTRKLKMIVHIVVSLAKETQVSLDRLRLPALEAHEKEVVALLVSCTSKISLATKRSILTEQTATLLGADPHDEKIRTIIDDTVRTVGKCQNKVNPILPPAKKAWTEAPATHTGNDSLVINDVATPFNPAAIVLKQLHEEANALETHPEH